MDVGRRGGGVEDRERKREKERTVPNVTVYSGRRVPSRFCTTRGETHELCMRPDVGEETVEVMVVYNTEVVGGIVFTHTRA